MPWPNDLGVFKKYHTSQISPYFAHFHNRPLFGPFLGPLEGGLCSNSRGPVTGALAKALKLLHYLHGTRTSAIDGCSVHSPLSHLTSARSFPLRQCTTLPSPRGRSGLSKRCLTVYPTFMSISPFYLRANQARLNL